MHINLLLLLLFIYLFLLWLNLVPGAFPFSWGGGWEKTLASTGHVTFRHLKILGVINFGLHEL